MTPIEREGKRIGHSNRRWQVHACADVREIAYTAVEKRRAVIQNYFDAPQYARALNPPIFQHRTLRSLSCNVQQAHYAFPKTIRFGDHTLQRFVNGSSRTPLLITNPLPLSIKRKPLPLLQFVAYNLNEQQGSFPSSFRSIAAINWQTSHYGWSVEGAKR
jgi:hypothetical protein